MRRFAWPIVLGAAWAVFATSAPCPACDYPVRQWKAWSADASGCYPGETWQKYATPEEAGWCSEKLRAARECYEQLDSAAVMVIYDGAVLVEWGDVGRRFMCHSIRKSYLSALYGIHVAEGRIDLNRTLAEMNIDDRPPLTDAEKQARLVDLLRSRSGVYHPAAYETPKMKEKRPPRGSHCPGSVFWYNNWDFNALCTIFEQQSATKVFEEFQQRFALPLQMQDFRLRDTYYHLEDEHSVHPAYPFRMSARDMARFGLLFLRNGKWQQKQILPEQWIRESVTSHFRETDTTPNPKYGYGYLWWPVVAGPFEDLGMYSARGFGGHAIDVVPPANLVFVHRVDTYWDLAHFEREKIRVEDDERFRLLDLVLRARIGPAKDNPQLVPSECCPKRVPTAELDPDRLAGYTGEYDFGEFRLSVEMEDGELVLSEREIGRFGLLPLSETEFLIEDVETPVTFEREGEGGPLRTSVEFAPGRKTYGRAVPPQDGREKPGAPDD